MKEGCRGPQRSVYLDPVVLLGLYLYFLLVRV
jgi:hypothetical protein